MSHTFSRPLLDSHLEEIKTTKLTVARCDSASDPTVTHTILVGRPERVSRLTVRVGTTVSVCEGTIDCVVAVTYALAGPLMPFMASEVDGFAEDVALPQALCLTRQVVADMSRMMLGVMILLEEVPAAPPTIDDAALQDWFPPCSLLRL
ncbi:hypothetical protein DEU37_2755 [Microbacterium sp. AG790]|uniref:hypothetical protein n=1 Tax=Microbacterium sp. AG790 TaxID=2183995 RepID=UPI000EAB8BBC|nr:hypothetical protein [Microbacterium sp. AG790]RKS85700.1 hypothetical protein DEU37_2755 [Microbacterium sp. AG790]